MAGTGSSKVVDPIAYRAEEQQSVDTPVTEESTNWNFDPSKLQNADVNLSAYGDDSSETNYNNQDLWGGENSKYTGAETKNTSVAYDKNASLENLNPNYAYGQKAQMVNSSDAGYIQRRNDQIASALYNAGKTSIQDVADYLNQQQGFMDSNENERNNTIASVWKRLGEIGKDSSNGDENENNEGNGQPVEDNSAVENMESDLLSDTSGKIYGKVTADENGADSSIKTLSDAYNVEQAVNRQRINNFKALQSMDSDLVASLLSEGNSVYGDQAMRDLMQYDPQKYQEIQQKIKEIRAQEVVNQLSEDGNINITDQLDKAVDEINDSTETFVNTVSNERTADQLSTNLSNVLSESEIVSSAVEQRRVYQKKIEDIQQSINELPSLAKKYFKSDVPQYMVNAFVQNRLQKYNAELEKYQNLYNGMLEEAKWEISQAQWREEMNYKRAQAEADQNYKTSSLNLQRQAQTLSQQNNLLNAKITMMKDGKWNDDGSFSYVDPFTGSMITVPASEASDQVNSIVATNADAFFAEWQEKLNNASANGVKCYGQQCETFTDNYTEEFYGVRMEGEGHSWTTAEEKAGYVNTQTASKGLVAVWNYKNGTEAMQKYGHTGIVMDVDWENGTFTYMASNNKGDEAVGIYTGNLYDGNLVGFRDPTKPKGMNNKEEGVFEYYATPMRDIFLQAYNSAKTKDLKADIQSAEDSYSILYDLQSNGYIDKVLNAKGFDTLMSQISNGKFATSDGNIDFAKISDYARNKLKDENVAYTIDRFHRLIEKKLRKESGAAISQSEWNSNFDMYLPAIGQSADYKRKKLIALEMDMVANQLPTNYRQYYVPIIPSKGTKKKTLFGGMNDD